MTKLKIRFPNESFFGEILINLDEFQSVNEFDEEIFGWYNNTYISIKKDESYRSNIGTIQPT
jgi:hypothetical protein